VNFIGGGLSWNEETAARPLTIGSLLSGKEGFYINDVSPLQLSLAHIGLLKASDKRNPLHDWHVLNIPYVTADFHIGNNDFPYQSLENKRGQTSNKILHHHGQQNAAAALDLLKDFFPQTPDTLLIMGQSAGGFGCLAHCHYISSLYPSCNQVIVYADGAHLHSSLWPEVAGDVWRVNSELLPSIKSKDLIVDLFQHAQAIMPPTTLFLHSNSVWDKALTEVMYKMNHGKLSINPQALEEFHTTLVHATNALRKDVPNYHYYVSDYGKSRRDGTTPHVFAGTPKLLYSKMQDGTSVAEWLSRALGRDPISVGTQFLQNS